MPDREQVIKELEKQIRLTESVNSGWVYLTIEKAKKALELLKGEDDDGQGEGNQGA